MALANEIPPGSLHMPIDTGSNAAIEKDPGPVNEGNVDATSPKMKGGGLIERLVHDLEDVKAVYQAKNALHRDLDELRTANEDFRRKQVGFNHAQITQQTRITMLEQENAVLNARVTELSQQEDRTQLLERVCKDLRVEHAVTATKHKARIITLEHEKAEVKSENTKLIREKKILADRNEALTEANVRLMRAIEPRETEAATQRTSLVWKDREARIKTLVALEEKIKDMRRRLGEVDDLSEKLTAKSDTIALLERQNLKMRQQLDVAADLQDANAAASCRIAKLESEVMGLRSLLDAERMSCSRANKEVKEGKENTDRIEAEKTALQLAVQSSDAVLASERLQVQAWQWEQNHGLALLRHSCARLT